MEESKFTDRRQAVKPIMVACRARQGSIHLPVPLQATNFMLTSAGPRHKLTGQLIHRPAPFISGLLPAFPSTSL